MSIMMFMVHNLKQAPAKTIRRVVAGDFYARQSSSKEEKQTSPRLEAFRKMLREKTPIGKLDQQESSNVEDDMLTKHFPPWPDNTNPHTGEIGGPRGPEPTRYGDWERKGKVSDF